MTSTIPDKISKIITKSETTKNQKLGSQRENRKNGFQKDSHFLSLLYLPLLEIKKKKKTITTSTYPNPNRVGF
uniref:Uncharacterized protein n=1 Tax=Nelumbo nucifera TaxID=4432 RepID=A0A822YWQ0_NELNU|nr:TPA_asm: hypothetical protein HUJ06_007763 [Nelumbo nucifera]